MPEYRLYCVGESGNSYKVALMLTLCAADWEPVFVDYFKGETRGDEFRDGINAQGEVPVLEHQGRRLSQSGAILTYLADRFGKYGGHTPEERLEVLRWLLFDNHKFTSYFATLRFLVGISRSGDPAVIEFLRGRALGALALSTSIWRHAHTCSATTRQLQTSRWWAITITLKRPASIAVRFRISRHG